MVTILKHSNYSVDAVYNGEDALDYARTGLYDGIILDIMMPKIDGITVLKSIRKEGSNVPVLLLTAKSEIDDRVTGLDSGADDYLTKPFAVKPFAESYQKQKRFITDASHEIKTPLTIIDANTEVLNMKYGENEWLKSTSNQVKRLTKLTERLVFLSRMDEEREVLQKTDFSISDAVYEAARSFKAMAKSQNKTLNISVQPNVSYYGDESSIIRLVSLLLENAMKYSDDEGTVSLKFCTNGKNKVLSVKNTVAEIQKGKLDMLFDRFYRIDKSRNSQTGGFGIGLSVAKAIVNAHKGKITAVSTDGKSIEITAVL